MSNSSIMTPLNYFTAPYNLLRSVYQYIASSEVEKLKLYSKSADTKMILVCIFGICREDWSVFRMYFGEKWSVFGL